jgi:hypothetical protein
MRRITITLVIIVTISLIGAAFTSQATSLEQLRQHLKQRLGQQETNRSCALSFGKWNWFACVQGAWGYEADYPGEPCQKPWVSKERLSGDCDDFAVMVAYYFQEYWGNDTYIIRTYRQDKRAYHFTAFLWVTAEAKDSIAGRCSGSYPYQTWKGRIYIPIDWSLCPDWTWIHEGHSNTTTFEWNDLVGKPI